MRFIFFTKTHWDEPPRIRHQLVYLLEKYADEIIFFEKPNYFFNRTKSKAVVANKITLLKHKQIFHHKLQINSFIRFINIFYCKKQILKLLNLSKIDNEVIIINFNYEYFFLKDLFPKNKIITIINDNFWSKAIFNFQKPLLNSLEKTLNISDKVLTVSKKLKDSMPGDFDVDLFYPWNTYKYETKGNIEEKYKLIYWGYINHRLDFEFLNCLLNEFESTQSRYEILFIGPSNNCLKELNNLKKSDKFTLLPPKDLKDIDFTKTLATLIPYKAGIESIEAISFPNKILPLLSKGLPILHTGMPYIIDEEFIFKLDSKSKDSIKIINFVKENYINLQPGIKKFLEENSIEKRTLQLFSYF